MMIQINSKVKEVLEWVYCIAIALVLALLIRYFIGTPTVVMQVSMKPTLIQGQRLILNKTPKTFHGEYKRGDIITFEAPSQLDAKSEKAEYTYKPHNWFESFTYYVLEINKMSYIKRVIALPGEHVEIKEGAVYINGEKLQEDYLQDTVITEPQNSNLIDFTVPEGHIFAMGDNRLESMDCRKFGCIPIEKIESKVWIRFWPFNLFGKVD